MEKVHSSRNIQSRIRSHIRYHYRLVDDPTTLATSTTNAFNELLREVQEDKASRLELADDDSDALAAVARSCTSNLGYERLQMIVMSAIHIETSNRSASSEQQNQSSSSHQKPPKRPSWWHSGRENTVLEGDCPERKFTTRRIINLTRTLCQIIYIQLFESSMNIPNYHPSSDSSSSSSVIFTKSCQMFKSTIAATTTEKYYQQQQDVEANENDKLRDQVLLSSSSRTLIQTFLYLSRQTTLSPQSSSSKPPQEVSQSTLLTDSTMNDIHSVSQSSLQPSIDGIGTTTDDVNGQIAFLALLYAQSIYREAAISTLTNSSTSLISSTTPDNETTITVPQMALLNDDRKQLLPSNSIASNISDPTASNRRSSLIDSVWSSSRSDPASSAQHNPTYRNSIVDAVANFMSVNESESRSEDEDDCDGGESGDFKNPFSAMSDMKSAVSAMSEPMIMTTSESLSEEDLNSVAMIRRAIVRRYGELLFSINTSGSKKMVMMLYHNGNNIINSEEGDDDDDDVGDNFDALLHLSKPLLVDNLTMQELDNGILSRWNEMMIELRVLQGRTSGDWGAGGVMAAATRVVRNLTTFIEILGECGHGHYLHPHLLGCAEYRNIGDNVGTNLIFTILDQIILATETSPLSSSPSFHYGECCCRVLESLVMAYPFPLKGERNNDGDGGGGLARIMQGTMQILSGGSGGSYCEKESNYSGRSIDDFLSGTSGSVSDVSGEGNHNYGGVSITNKCEDLSLIALIGEMLERIATSMLEMMTSEEEEKNTYGRASWMKDGNDDALWLVAYDIILIFQEMEKVMSSQAALGILRAHSAWEKVVERVKSVVGSTDSILGIETKASDCSSCCSSLLEMSIGKKSFPSHNSFERSSMEELEVQIGSANLKRSSKPDFSMHSADIMSNQNGKRSPTSFEKFSSSASRYNEGSSDIMGEKVRDCEAEFSMLSAKIASKQSGKPSSAALENDSQPASRYEGAMETAAEKLSIIEGRLASKFGLSNTSPINNDGKKMPSQVPTNLKNDEASALSVSIDAPSATAVGIHTSCIMSDSDRIKSKRVSFERSASNDNYAKNKGTNAVAKLDHQISSKFQYPTHDALSTTHQDEVHPFNSKPSDNISGHTMEVEKDFEPLIINPMTPHNSSENCNDEVSALLDSSQILHKERNVLDLQNFNEDEGELAVAVAITECETHDLDDAVLYDPRSISRLSKSKKCWFCVAIILSVTVAVIVGLLVGRSNSAPMATTAVPSQIPSQVPSASPSLSVQPTTDIIGEIKKHVEQSYAGDTEILNSKPYDKAFEWIIIDSLVVSSMSNTTIDDTSVVVDQRFCLALFYFQMMGETWTNCSHMAPHPNCTVVDRDDIVVADRKLWLSESNECEWGGIVCDKDNTDVVVEIHLNELGLKGSIPKEITKLTKLRELYLMNNNIEGHIPTEIGTLSKLVAIDFRNNSLSHTIPMELYSLIDLKDLTLGYNRLSGTIASHIGNLKSLKVLHVAGNILTGSIPSEIGLINLDVLTISNNNFSGSLPTEFNRLTMLHTLFMNYNDFTGELQLPIAPRLTELPVNNNRFNGTLPDNLYKLTNLHYLDASNNEFTGKVKAAIGNLSHLQVIKFRKNSLQGTIPEEIENLKHLDMLQLTYNNFEGEVSNGICDLDIKTFATDCGKGRGVEGSVKVFCACCTTCCDPTGICYIVE